MDMDMDMGLFGLRGSRYYDYYYDDDDDSCGCHRVRTYLKCQVE